MVHSFGKQIFLKLHVYLHSRLSFVIIFVIINDFAINKVLTFIDSCISNRLHILAHAMNSDPLTCGNETNEVVVNEPDEVKLRRLLNTIYEIFTTKIKEDLKVIESITDPKLRNILHDACEKHHASIMTQNIDEVHSFVVGKSVKDPSQYTCGICHNNLENPLKALSCGHIFCIPCVEHLFSNAAQEWGDLPECPKCRSQLISSTVVYI